MKYKNKKRLAWTLILVPAIYFIILGITRFIPSPYAITPISTGQIISGIVTILFTILWLIGDYKLSKLTA